MHECTEGIKELIVAIEVSQCNFSARAACMPCSSQKLTLLTVSRHLICRLEVCLAAVLCKKISTVVVLKDLYGRLLGFSLSAYCVIRNSGNVMNYCSPVCPHAGRGSC